MQAFTPRSGRRSLARTIVVLAAASSLSACAAETTAPALNPRPRGSAAEALAPTVYTTTVDLYVGSHITVHPADGAAVAVAVSCSANTTFDVIVELEQQQKAGATKTTVSGSHTFPGLMCSTGSAGYTAVILPTTGAFKRGGATVRARIENTQPGVEPAEITRRARLYDVVE